jgi:hypothetical protein
MAPPSGTMSKEVLGMKQVSSSGTSRRLTNTDSIDWFNVDRIAVHAGGRSRSSATSGGRIGQPSSSFANDSIQRIASANGEAHLSCTGRVPSSYFDKRSALSDSRLGMRRTTFANDTMHSLAPQFPRPYLNTGRAAPEDVTELPQQVGAERLETMHPKEVKLIIAPAREGRFLDAESCKRQDRLLRKLSKKMAKLCPG